MSEARAGFRSVEVVRREGDDDAYFIATKD
jgi:hypothetical protein